MTLPSTDPDSSFVCGELAPGGAGTSGLPAATGGAGAEAFLLGGGGKFDALVGLQSKSTKHVPMPNGEADNGDAVTYFRE